MSSQVLLGEDFLHELYADYFGYRVLSIVQSHDYGADGRLHDTVEITFQLTDHPGSFTIAAPYDQNLQTSWRGPVGALADAVRAIYAL